MIFTFVNCYYTSSFLFSDKITVVVYTVLGRTLYSLILPIVAKEAPNVYFYKTSRLLNRY